MSWTAQDCALLEELAEAGRSAGEIAKRLGKTRNAVIGKARRTGVELRSGSEGQVTSGSARLTRLTAAITAAMLSRRWRRRNAPAHVLLEEAA